MTIQRSRQKSKSYLPAGAYSDDSPALNPGRDLLFSAGAGPEKPGGRHMRLPLVHAGSGRPM